MKEHAHIRREKPELKNACHLKLPWLESGEQEETKMTRKSLQAWPLSLFTHLAKRQKIPKFSFTVHLEIHQLVQY